MLTVNKLIAQGRGLSRVLLDRAATVSLDSASPSGHRFETTDSQGRTVAVLLAEGSQVLQGDVLVTEDGELIRVGSGPAPVHGAHDHVHGPGCSHEHGHGHASAKIDIHPAPQPHVHGPDCGHGHGH